MHKKKKKKTEHAKESPETKTTIVSTHTSLPANAPEAVDTDTNCAYTPAWNIKSNHEKFVCRDNVF